MDVCLQFRLDVYILHPGVHWQSNSEASEVWQAPRQE